MWRKGTDVRVSPRLPQRREGDLIKSRAGRREREKGDSKVTRWSQHKSQRNEGGTARVYKGLKIRQGLAWDSGRFDNTTAAPLARTAAV